MSDAEEVWRRRSDDQLVEAAQRIEEYTDEGRDVIRAELSRRGITEPHPASQNLRPEVLSLDNLASLGDRLAGQILDSIVAIVAVVVSAIPSAISDTIGAITLVCGVVFFLFYILFADGFRNGQSYGKRIMKTAVVDATTAEPCTFFQSFVRNLLLAILGVIDWVFIFGQRRQRLGDKAANTLVIKTAP